MDPEEEDWTMEIEFNDTELAKMVELYLASLGMNGARVVEVEYKHEYNRGLVALVSKK